MVIFALMGCKKRLKFLKLQLQVENTQFTSMTSLEKKG